MMRADAFLDETPQREPAPINKSAEAFLDAESFLESDAPAPERETAVAQPDANPEPSMNMARGAIERGGDLLGGLFTAGNALAEKGEESYPLGGLVWEDGILPDYKGPGEYAKWRAEQGGNEPLKVAADHWSNLDAGYQEEHTWEKVKQEFSEGGALSGSAWAEVMAYGAEQGVKSIPDMVAALVALPSYIMARSGEIGKERAKNKGKQEADLTDVLEAAPAAIGSAILERIGAKGITEAGAEALGKEALKQGLGKVAKEGAKAGGKEAATEFMQEGIIEYLGEKLGTDAALSFSEALDRGAAGAVAGGVYGTGAGTAGAVVNQSRDNQQEPKISQTDAAPPVVQEEVQSAGRAEDFLAEATQDAAPTDDNASVNDYEGRPEWADAQTNIFRDGVEPAPDPMANPLDAYDDAAKRAQPEVEQPAPEPQAEIQPEPEPTPEPAPAPETGLASDDLSPYERNQLREAGVTDEQLWDMPTDEARQQLKAVKQQVVEPMAQPEPIERQNDGEPTNARQQKQAGNLPTRDRNQARTDPRATVESDGERDGRNGTQDQEVAPGAARFSFAGPKAKTADTFTLDNAKQQIEQGADAETVRKETGWFEGKDGKWRFEVDDSDARYLPHVNKTAGKLWTESLEDVLDHPKLFAAYPQLRNLDVVSAKGMGGLRGSYNEKSGEIMIDAEQSTAEQFSTLLHEIQHGVQSIEGFARGGNSDSVAYVVREDLLRKASERGDSKLLADYQNALRPYGRLSKAKQIVDFRNITQPRQLFNSSYWYEYSDQIRDVFGTPPKRGPALRQYAEQGGAWIANRLERQADFDVQRVLERHGLARFQSNGRDQEARRKLNNEYRKAERKFHKVDRTRLQQAHATKAEIDRLQSVPQYEAHELYRRLYGEVEARNVQARQSMTEQERREVSPEQTQDVANDDAIVVMRGREMQNAPAPNNAPPRQGSNYRLTPNLPMDYLTVSEANAISDELMQGWKGAPDVIIREKVEQFPSELQLAIRLAGAENDMRGVLWGDDVYLLASRIPDRQVMEQVILHEVVGHYGLRKMLGKKLERVLNQIWASHGGKTRADFIIRRYYPGTTPRNTFDVNNKEHRHTVAEELIAHLAEQNRGQTLVQRAVAIIREGLRKLGFTLEFTVDDIVDLLRRARKTVENGGFERGGEFQANTAPASRFSRSGIPDLDPQPFGPPSDTLLRKAISKIADKHIVLKGVQKNIKDLYGPIDESADTYMAEELFHGKVENDLRLIQENMIEPLAKDMSKSGISLKQLDEFLYALHAPERNKVIAERDPAMPDGGSGMTNAEAATIINKVDKAGKLAEYKALASQVHKMLERRRAILKNAGLLDDETLGAWEASYKFYVPLKGWASDEQQDSVPRIGKGFAISGKESQMAAGRKSKAASPVANAISDLSEAVLRHRKNEVGNAFLNLVSAYPNGSYWRVFTADNPEVDRKVVKRKDPETGKMKYVVQEQAVPMAMMADRYFTTKVDGETYYIKIEDERLLNAMRNIGPDNNGLLVRALSMVTRLMSSLNTSYNPEFVISNFSRDIQTAILNLTSEQSADDGKARGKKIAAKTVKDVPTAIRAINASMKGKPLDGKAGEWQKHFDQFRADGAKTGWFDMKDVDGQMEDLETMISMASGGAGNSARKAFRAVSDWVENTNVAIENGVRLSAYVNAINAGIPRAQAASLAKNMTVNFNRRGELGTTMNALYMFANASIQGTANFVRTLGRLNGQKGDRLWSRMNKAQKIAVGMAVGGFTLSALNRLVAGDDDDGVNWWDKVPDYVKERNIVIMKSLVGGEPGEYWTIPLPYGYNIFPVIGTSMEQMLASDKPAGDIAGNVILAALGSFSPIGFEQSEEAYGVIAKNVMPTILRPVASISLNENFMGGPIYKENLPFGTQKPDSSLSFRSTPEVYKELAKGLNEASGGSEYRSGAVDLSPDVMQFLVGYYGGGAYDFFSSRAPSAALKMAQGVELEDREIPFYRKLHGKVLPYEDQSKFYDRRNEINQLLDERENLRGRERVEFMKEFGDKMRLSGAMKSVEKRLKNLRKQKDRIEAMELSAAEEDERLKVVEQRMKQAIDQFNERYNEVDD